MIEVRDLVKEYPGARALDGISFSISKGDIVGFLGPNGAGKSTTMKILTGFIPPSSGSVTVAGFDVVKDSLEVRRRVGYLPENNPLYTEMLVSEWLDYVAGLRGIRGAERRTSLDEAIAATGIEDVYHRPIGELSKGFRQRVGLAAAILHRPDLLVLDEPTEGLDPNQRVEIRRLIGRLGRERTVILSTHILPEVQFTCSRLLIINRGRIVADGPVDDLVSRAKDGARISVEVAGAGVADRLGELPGVRGVEARPTEGNRIRAMVTVAGSDDLRPRVFELAKASGWTLFELHQEAGSLEDLFRHLTTDQEPA
jgi:ABC-2 type transport system ATP-binding protein